MFSHSTLVDTSVWIDLFEKGRDSFFNVAVHPNSRCHPFVVGEFAVGNLGGRHDFIDALKTVEKLSIIDDDTVLEFIIEKKLHSRGIGYIDCHLLASAYFLPNTLIWTRDKRLYAAMSQLGLAFTPETT